MSSEGAPTQSVFLVGSAGKASTDLRRPCGPSAGSAPALLAYAYHGCARSSARRFTRIWTTWIAESLADRLRPRLVSLTRRYLIVGNGIAGQTCAEELRKLDAEASITMVAAERHPLYNRVALPRYLRGQVRREKVFMRTVEDYARQNLDIHFETWVTDIDPRAKVAH